MGNAERNRILRELDIQGFMRALPPDARAALRAKTEAERIETALAAMHKARYEIPEMGPERRTLSRQWLQARGYGRWRGTWPPEGVLEG